MNIAMHHLIFFVLLCLTTSGFAYRVLIDRPSALTPKIDHLDQRQPQPAHTLIYRSPPTSEEGIYGAEARSTNEKGVLYRINDGDAIVKEDPVPTIHEAHTTNEKNAHYRLNEGDGKEKQDSVSMSHDEEGTGGDEPDPDDQNVQLRPSNGKKQQDSKPGDEDDMDHGESRPYENGKENSQVRPSQKGKMDSGVKSSNGEEKSDGESIVGLLSEYVPPHRGRR